MSARYEIFSACKQHARPQTNGVFTLPDSDSCTDADTDSCTEKVTIEVNRMELSSVLNRYRTHLSQPKSRSRSTGNTSEHYH